MVRNENHSRRYFLGKLATASLFALAGTQVLSGCGEKKEPAAADQPDINQPVSSCNDLMGVSENDLAVRKKLGYVEKSPIADNQCQNCNLYLPPKPEHKCGGCMLFKGPVFNDAYCTYWAPKV